VKYTQLGHPRPAALPTAGDSSLPGNNFLFDGIRKVLYAHRVAVQMPVWLPTFAAP